MDGEEAVQLLVPDRFLVAVPGVAQGQTEDPGPLPLAALRAPGVSSEHSPAPASEGATPAMAPGARYPLAHHARSARGCV